MLFLSPEDLRSQLAEQMAEKPREQDFTEELQHLVEIETSQRDYLYPLHSEWYVQILACHGFHNVNYNLYTGTPYFTGSGKPKPAWNIIGTIASRFKAYIAAARPKRIVVPKSSDDRDVRGARYGNQILSWAYDHHDYSGLYAEARDWFVKTGNFFVYMPWDDRAGEQITLPDGSVGFTGETKIEIDSPFRWMLDPRVARSKDAMWARRRTFQPMEWVRMRFPDRAHKIREDDVFPADSLFFEYQLLNLTPLHVSTVGGTTRTTPKNQGFIEVFEYFEKPCDKYPEGRTIIAMGRMGTPEVVLYSGPMPYEKLPVVMASMDTVPGRAFGESPIKYMMYPQQEINTRRVQIKRNADAFGSLKLLWPDDGGVAPQQMNNEAGILPYSGQAQNAPSFLVAPPMPEFVFHMEKSSLELMNFMAEPAGPLSMERAQKTTSGVHMNLLQEQEQIITGPTMDNWNRAWVEVDNIYLSNMRSFGAWPRTFAPISSETTWGMSPAFQASGMMLSKNLNVKLVPGTEMPQSRATIFANHIELAKAQLIAPDDKMARRRVFENIGMGDDTLYWRDENGPITQARNNLEILKTGQLIEPDIMDDPELQILVILDWMRTTEYRMWKSMYPERDAVLRMGYAKFSQAAIFVSQQRYKQALVQQGIGQGLAGPPQPVPGAGAPGGDASGGASPKMTQGFGTSTSNRKGGPNPS